MAKIPYSQYMYIGFIIVAFLASLNELRAGNWLLSLILWGTIGILLLRKAPAILGGEREYELHELVHKYMVWLEQQSGLKRTITNFELDPAPDFDEASGYWRISLKHRTPQGKTIYDLFSITKTAKLGAGAGSMTQDVEDARQFVIRAVMPKAEKSETKDYIERRFGELMSQIPGITVETKEESSEAEV